MYNLTSLAAMALMCVLLLSMISAFAREAVKGGNAGGLPVLAGAGFEGSALAHVSADDAHGLSGAAGSAQDLGDRADISAESVRVATTFARLLGAGDIPGLTALFAPDGIWWFTGDPALFPMAGPHKATEVLKLMPMDRMSRWEVELKSVIASGDHAVAEATAIGVGPGDAVYHATYSWHFRIENGRIAELREYCDTLAAMNYAKQLGQPAD